MRDGEAGMTWGMDEEALAFRKSLPLQMMLQETIRAVGDVSGLTCVDVGAKNSMLSRHLRQRGGQWETVVLDPAAAEAAKHVLGTDVYVAENGTLPFDKKIFDAVVVFDVLESIQNDEKFIEECHRILKPDGRLILHVRRYKRLSLLTPVWRSLGLSPETRGLVRAGYTESQLFGILKHGFNVLNVHSYSRFFVQLVDAVLTRLEMRFRSKGNKAAVRRAWFCGAVFYSLGYQMDLLLFFTRGYYMVASAKRRAWRPRTVPVLSVGRAISEAVLTRAPR